MSTALQYGLVEAAAWERVGETPRNVLNEFPPAFSTLKIARESLDKDLECTLHFASGANLNKADKQALLHLIKSNMEDIYNKSSWGWNEKKKLRELTHEEARFLLVREAGNLVAMLHFRFEVVNKTPVVYCYEIQVEAGKTGLGIGKRLMVLLEILARKFAMEKVVLTVLEQNPGARAFYGKLGYDRDEDDYADERLEEGDGCSYEILSKRIKRPNA